MDKYDLETFVRGKLSAAVSSLYQDETYSDLTIVCGEKSFKVHKAVVCSQSPYFHTACTRFREGGEGLVKLMTVHDSTDERTIEAIEADDPEIVEHMIYFLYHQDCPKKGTEESMTLYAKVFAAATKFQVEALQKLTAFKFTDLLHDIDVNDETNTADFAEALRLVWTTTPKNITDLREPVTYALLRDRALVESKAVTEAIDAVEGLTMALLVENMRRTEVTGKQECNYCRDDTSMWYECTGCGFNQPDCYGCTQHMTTGRNEVACPRCGEEKWVRIYVKEGEEVEGDEGEE